MSRQPLLPACCCVDTLAGPQDDPPDYFYLLLSGKARVTRHTTLRLELTIGTLDPGAYFGECCPEPVIAT